MRPDVFGPDAKPSMTIHEHPESMPSRTAKSDFLKLAAEARADWLIGCVPPRPGSGFERAVFIAGLGEILALRLQAAYMPLLQGLQRIEDRVNVLATIREDPYAPPPKKTARETSIAPAASLAVACATQRYRFPSE